MCNQPTVHDLALAQARADKLRERRGLDRQYRLDQFWIEQRKRSRSARVRNALSEIFHRLVGPTGGGGRPAQVNSPAPGGSEGVSNA